jgi:hypothetical protein
VSINEAPGRGSRLRQQSTSREERDPSRCRGDRGQQLPPGGGAVMMIMPQFDILSWRSRGTCAAARRHLNI